MGQGQTLPCSRFAGRFAGCYGEQQQQKHPVLPCQPQSQMQGHWAPSYCRYTGPAQLAQLTRSFQSPASNISASPSEHHAGDCLKHTASRWAATMPRWGKRVLGPELASWERRKPIYLKETKTTKKVFSFKMYICN